MAVDATAAVAAAKARILARWKEKIDATPAAFAGVIDPQNPDHRALFADVLRAWADEFDGTTPEMVWPPAVDTAAGNRAEALVQTALDELNG